MRLYFERASSRLVLRPGYAGNLAGIALKRADRVVLQLRFYDDGEPVMLDGASIVFAIKKTYSGPLLAVATGWSEVGDAYRAELDTHTSEILAELGGSAYVDLLGELTYTDALGGPVSSQTLTVRIENDVYKGDEGAPTALPTPDDWLDLRGVRYDAPQDLNPSQQAQARENIGSPPPVIEADRAPGNADVKAQGGFGHQLAARAIAPGSNMNGVQVTLSYASGGSGPELDPSSTPEHWKIEINYYLYSENGDVEIAVNAINSLLAYHSAGVEVIWTMPDPENYPFPSFGSTITATLAGGSVLDAPERPGQRWIWPAAGRSWVATDDDDPPVWRQFLFAGDDLAAPLITATGGTYLFGSGMTASQLVSPGNGYFWMLPMATATLAHTGPAAQTFAGPVTVNGQVEAPNQTAANGSRLLTRDNADARYARRNFARVKAAHTNRANTTTYAADPDLAVANLPVGRYRVELGFQTYNDAAGGIKYQFGGSATVAATGRGTGMILGNPSQCGYVNDPLTGESVAPWPNGTRLVRLDFTIHVTAAGSFALEWAQHTSHGTLTQIHAGGYLVLTPVD